MNLFVLLKMVPDTVEELKVAADGKSLDAELLRFKLERRRTSTRWNRPSC